MKSEPKQGDVDVAKRRIRYSVHRSERKNVRIVVNPDLSIMVYAPQKATLDQVDNVVNKKARWIAGKLDSIEMYHPLPAPKQYISGETFVYLGRQYRLKVVNGASGTAKLSGKYLWVSVSDRSNREEAEKVVSDWYREHAQAVFERYLSQCSIVTARHGVPEATLSIRKMKMRWGSCTPSGRIILNLFLVQAPVHCIEYVIMHELCHLKHHNHSPGFYRLLTRCQPDWRIRKETLDRFILA